MQTFYPREYGLLPEAMAKQSDSYFYHGNFHEMYCWENSNASSLLLQLQTIYEGLGGIARWKQPFEFHWFLEELAKAVGAGEYIGEYTKAALGDYYRLALEPSAQNAKKAFFWYHSCGQANCLEGMLAVAYCYQKGLGVKEDWEQSAVWEQRYNEMYERRFSRPDDSDRDTAAPYEIAKSLLQLKAGRERGELFATLQLAYCYLYGLGVRQDLRKPFEWCQKILEQLGVKQAKGTKALTREEIAAREAALELLGCYYLQGVDGLVKPSFWRAAALRVMSTSYDWKALVAQNNRLKVGLSSCEAVELEKSRRQYRSKVFEEMEDEYYLESPEFREQQDNYLLKFPNMSRSGAQREVEYEEGEARVAKWCQYQPLHLKEEYARAYRNALLDKWYGIQRLLPDTSNLKASTQTASEKIWIFSVQTPGLNLLYEYFGGKNLAENPLQLAYRIHRGSATQLFAIGNCFLSAPGSTRSLEKARQWFKNCVSLTLTHHVVQHYDAIGQLCNEEKLDERYIYAFFDSYGENWQAPAQLYAYGHFFMRPPTQDTLNLMLSSILYERYCYPTPLEALLSEPKGTCGSDKTGIQLGLQDAWIKWRLVPRWYRDLIHPVSDPEPSWKTKDRLLPVCEFELFWNRLSAPFEHEFTRMPKNLCGFVANHWFRRQHLLWSHYLRTSLYIHEPWISAIEFDKKAYQPDLDRANSYLFSVYYDFQEWEVFSSLRQRLEEQNGQRVAKPEQFYPALGWSKYWKQSLITLNPSEADKHLDCEPFKGGLFCSD